MKEVVVITGGTGFVGQNLWNYIRANPVLLKKYTFYRFYSKDIDLLKLEDTAKIMTKYKPKYIIHLAALCGGIGANQMNPARFWSHNLVMATNLFDAAVEFKVKKIVTLGTVCSYGKFAKAPFTEDQLYTEWPEITNRPYGVAKLAMYEGLRAYHSQFNLEFSYLIPSNMYGPHDHFTTQTSHVIPAILVKMMKAVEKGEWEVNLWGDGSPTRDFLYVDDTIRAILMALETDTGTLPINLGTGEEISMKVLAEFIAGITGYKGDIIWNANMPNGQPHRMVDFKRATEVLKWTPEIKLYDGLKKTYDWCKDLANKKKDEDKGKE